jgi:hypothetical protein
LGNTPGQRDHFVGSGVTRNYLSEKKYPGAYKMFRNLNYPLFQNPLAMQFGGMANQFTRKAIPQPVQTPSEATPKIAALKPKEELFKLERSQTRAAESKVNDTTPLFGRVVISLDGAVKAEKHTEKWSKHSNQIEGDKFQNVGQSSSKFVPTTSE